MSDAVFLEMLTDFQRGVTRPNDWLRQLRTVPDLVEFVIDWQSENRPFPGSDWQKNRPEAWQIAESRRMRELRAGRIVDDLPEEPAPTKRKRKTQQAELDL